MVLHNQTKEIGMLVIRMQRTGRKGHAQFRVVVQDSRRTPTSGKVVALLGSYNPHTKTSTLDKEKAGFYLEHGAQPTDRVVRLLTAEGVKMPAWVKKADGSKAKAIRNPEKLRRNRPAEESAPEEPPKEETTETEAPADEAPAEEVAAEETPVEEAVSEPEVAEEEPETKA
jgi:small subunit ribosomal protein S16